MVDYMQPRHSTVYDLRKPIQCGGYGSEANRCSNEAAWMHIGYSTNLLCSECMHVLSLELHSFSGIS